MIALLPLKQTYRAMFRTSMTQNFQSVKSAQNAQEARISISVNVANRTESSEKWQLRKMEETRKE